MFYATQFKFFLKMKTKYVAAICVAFIEFWICLRSSLESRHFVLVISLSVINNLSLKSKPLSCAGNRVIVGPNNLGHSADDVRPYTRTPGSCTWIDNL